MQGIRRGESIILAGVLATPQLCAALEVGAGQPVPLPGRLGGGGEAGLVPNGWPRLLQGSGSVTGLRAAASEALALYARATGLAPVATEAGEVLGLGSGEGPEGEPDPGLVAAVAAEVLTLAARIEPERIGGRLARIAGYVDARRRGAATVRRETGVPLPPADAAALTLHDRHPAYFSYFSVEAWTLSHRRHDGGQTPPVTREVFVMGDAVIVLPWDPVRDRVMVVTQFRIGPAARGEAQAWVPEPIAGRIDPGETPESTALREAAEEAGLTLDASRLHPGPHHYPSPGAVSEYLYAFVAEADLPDGCAGIGGLASEAEDIRAHLLPRAELAALARAGRLASGPLTLLALWLDAEAPRLLARP